MKNRRKHIVSIVAMTLVSVGGLAAMLGLGYSPALGLDLQGGASVVLEPVEETPEENLDQAIEIIRSRVDGLGVAEPDIARQGKSIVVQLPGVDDPQQALEVVGRTAELRFRPVLGVLPASGEVPELPPVPEGEGDEAEPTPDGEEAPAEGEGVEPAPEGAETPPEEGAEAPADDGATENGLGAPTDGSLEGAAGEPATRIELAADESTTTAAPEGEAPATTAPADEAAPEGDDQPEAPPAPEVPSGPVEVTSPDDDIAEQEVVLPGKRVDGEDPPLYRLGPARLLGNAVADAQARLDQTGTNWSVNIEMTDEGIETFNELAAECYATSEACPPIGTDQGKPVGAMAIVLDGIVESAPTINAPNFSKDQINISGTFTDSEARDLALVLRYGSLPVELEPQTVQTVSATLGSDSLRAGLIAGGVGIFLVALYLTLYYRLLGALAVVYLAVSGAFLYAIVCYLGETSGLALTLAGVTGIIVSIGVAVDSNVLYYERIKDSVMNGSTFRSATERGFKRSFSTNLRADAASLIGAALLYYFTVGPVRGFAFFLGLSTLIDLTTSYFFLRPATILLGRTRWARPSLMGIPADAIRTAVPAGGGR